MVWDGIYNVYMYLWHSYTHMKHPKWTIRWLFVVPPNLGHLHICPQMQSLGASLFLQSRLLMCHDAALVDLWCLVDFPEFMRVQMLGALTGHFVQTSEEGQGNHQINGIESGAWWRRIQHPREVESKLHPTAPVATEAVATLWKWH